MFGLEKHNGENVKLGIAKVSIYGWTRKRNGENAKLGIAKVNLERDFQEFFFELMINQFH